MCRALGVSRSGYYAWCRRGPSQRQQANQALLRRIRTIHEGSGGTYGAPRVHAELTDEGFAVSRKRVARLMRLDGLCGISRRRPWLSA